MAALLRQILELCLFRRGPQDLPYSVAATTRMLAALLGLQAAAGLMAGSPSALLAARLAVTLLLLAVASPWLLRSRGFDNRIAQTLLAQAGAALMYSLAMLPLTFALLPYAELAAKDVQPPPAVLLPLLAALVLFVWKLRIDTAIWRQALELRPPQALMLAIVMVLAEMFLLLTLARMVVPAVPAS